MKKILLLTLITLFIFISCSKAQTETEIASVNVNITKSEVSNQPAGLQPMGNFLPMTTSSENIDETAKYVVKFIDQNSNPVEGVMVQVCNDNICMVYTTDNNGLCTFEVAPFEYEVHTLFVPDGYEADTSLILHTKASDDEITFKINKK